jgi:hypothetical protein
VLSLCQPTTRSTSRPYALGSLSPVMTGQEVRDQLRYGFGCEVLQLAFEPKADVSLAQG